jgi:glycosyltransferase involved in cell wall biosynthesis
MNQLDSNPATGMAAPLVSVAMPVYNGERYLAEAIDSVLAQTMADFELIVIDDGSTDGSLRILRDYERRDARIRLIARENRNLVATLNDIIDVARGEWIARMDQDDIALPRRFERQLNWLELTGADVCGSWIKFFGTADRRVLTHPQTDEAVKMELLFGAPFAHPSVMMKTERVKALRYDKAWEKCEDYDLWERAARAGWKMTNVPEVLLLYRQHATQISARAFAHQQALTQKIRHRYWHYVSGPMGLNGDWIDEVLKLREASPAKANMDYVDAALAELLRRCEGEARATVFGHVTRLYLRAAADYPGVVARWGRLNREFGEGYAVATKLKLWLLGVLRIDPRGPLFQRLKRLYFFFARSGR